MKKTLLIIGLALAGVIHINAQSVTNSAASLAVVNAKIALAKVELQAQFFLVTPSPANQFPGYQPAAPVVTLNTNSLAQIPPVVSALSGGAVTLASNAPVFIAANTLNSAINIVAVPQRTVTGATNNLALLNAGLVAAGLEPLQ